MKHTLPPLDSLKVFESAARQLSFSLAADELHISKGAVSYQIRRLEEHLRCSLFRRSVRQVYLTDAGQALFRSTQVCFHELGDTLKRIGNQPAQQQVRIAATTYVAARWLSPRIARFSAQHPHVSIVLQHSVNASDFNLANVDIAVRWGLCRARRDHNRLAVMPMPLYPVCAPALLESMGHSMVLPKALSMDHPAGLRSDEEVNPLSVRDFAASPFRNATLLCEDRAQDLWSEWLGADTAGLINPQQVISDANVRVQAAIDGQGLVLADELMRTELNNGLLVAPFAEKLQGYGYSLYCSAPGLLNPNAQSLTDWLLSNISEA